MNNIIFVAIVLAACSFVCQILTMIAIRHLDEKITQSGAFYKTVLDIFDRMSDMHKSMLENIGRMKQLNDDIYEQYQTMCKQQELILKSYEIIKNENEMMLKGYKQIREAFARCEDRYSDIYDQWSEMTARYEDIKATIDKLKPSEETRVRTSLWYATNAPRYSVIGIS